jgi:presenilin-like A22 family membrane protease
MYFDVAMPIALFAITVVAMFLQGKLERRLRANFEEREFRVRDAVFLVVAISVTVSLIVFIPQAAIMTFFLLAYSMVLFTFVYVFSNLQKAKIRLFCGGFSLLTFVAGTLSLFAFGTEGTVVYGALALYCLSIFALIVLAYEEERVKTNERWYLAVLPPALFICLYLFFNKTPVWFPYLFNAYAITFATLIILYLGTLFTWKTAVIFAGLLTIMDIILVLVTGSMVSAAKHVSGLGLPMLVSIPTIPLIQTERGALYMSLGLGDFFFAGLLATQTFKKFGKNLAVLSAITMSVSFGIFETLLLNYELRAFPGTLMIICGWLPLIAWKELKK